MKASVSLRHLGLRRIDARLALTPRPITPAMQGQIRPIQLGSLLVLGDVFYDPASAAQPGALKGELGGARGERP